MKYNLPHVFLAAVMTFAAGCASAPHSENSATPRTTVAEKLGQLSIGQTKSEVVALIGQPDKSRTEESAGGVFEIWLYSRETLTVRIEGDSFLRGFAKGMSGTGPQPPVELRFLDGKLSTIVNR